MSRIIWILLLILFWSCRSDNKGLPKVDKKDTTYYVNGGIKSIGESLNNGNPIGEWHYFDSTGILTKKVQYLKIQGKSFPNQEWDFDKNGDTIDNSGTYYDLKILKDTIQINEPVKAKLDLISDFFKNEKSEIFIVLPKDYSINFNSDFSNISEVELDTTYNLNKELEMRKDIGLSPNTDFGKSAVFGRYFTSTGPKKFRGIIVEHFRTDLTTFDSIAPNFYKKYGANLEHNYNDSINPDSMKINNIEILKYFELDIFVKDSI